MGLRVVHRLALETVDYRLPTHIESRLMSPSLVIYAAKVRDNIRKVMSASGGRWRPHVKTTKCEWVFGELLSAGVRRFKCATPREALALGRTLQAHEVVGDVLCAFPHVGPNLRELERIAKRYSEWMALSVLVEDVCGAETTNLDVFLDINPGMDRTGVPLDRAMATTREVAQVARDRFKGIHVYDGHAPKLGKTRAEREPKLFEIYDKVLDTLFLPLYAHQSIELCTAGTPAFLSSVAHPGLRELGDLHTVSPGTVVFNDMTADDQLAPDLLLEPAALVFSRAVSKPTDRIITCDAGHKAVAADAGPPVACICGHPDFLPLKPSEEHLPIQIPQDAPPIDRGFPLYVVPRHVCPTVNLAESAILVHDRSPLVSIVNIEARAHDLFPGDDTVPRLLRDALLGD